MNKPATTRIASFLITIPFFFSSGSQVFASDFSAEHEILRPVFDRIGSGLACAELEFLIDRKVKTKERGARPNHLVEGQIVFECDICGVITGWTLKYLRDIPRFRTANAVTTEHPLPNFGHYGRTYHTYVLVTEYEKFGKKIDLIVDPSYLQIFLDFSSHPRLGHEYRRLPRVFIGDQAKFREIAEKFFGKGSALLDSLLQRYFTVAVSNGYIERYIMPKY